ncbi:MAG: hypothetical protein WB500_09100, partial [Rhodoplanes sp.]
IFQRFLRVGSMTRLTVALRSEGLRTKCGKPVDKGYLYLSLSQMSSGWRETANRVILSPDVGRLQIAWVAAHRVT